MTEETQASQNIQAGDNSVAVGSVNVGGSIGGDFFIGNKGFSADEVSVLITQISTTFKPQPFDGRSPYKGLETFNEEDSELFFGREKWVENLIGRVKESRTLFVTGQSGSGKSSLVRAGLIPALKTDYASGWLYATMKPGRDPIDALANAFSRLKDPSLGKYLRENAGQASVLHECAESALSERAEQRLVLFIDQFEEVFTQLSKDKAQTFINLLDHAAIVENGRVIILFSMRSDFVPNCATYPQLNDLLNQQFVQIGAMQPEELVSAIAQPALRVGLKIDPDLIAQIINDMKGEPGALPLMQFALKDLFDAEQAKGGMIALTLSDYLEHGGISQALERHANASLAQLTDSEKELARSVFSGLIEIGRGTQDTRRTALSNELIPAGTQADAVKMVVQKLASARLITTDAATVTISHEKLIDAWPWLKKLVNENRDVIALQNEIAADAKEWEEHKRDASYLYSGARLATAREKMKDQKLALSGLAQDFVEQSISLQDAERKAKESLRRRIIVGLISGIAIALVLAGFAFYLWLQALEQEEKARAGELAAHAITQRDKQFDLSLLLSIEAFNTHDTTQSRNVLFGNTQTNLNLIHYITGHDSYVRDVAFSPNGKTLASAGLDGTIILWTVETRERLGELIIGHDNSIYSIAFSPDGNLLASASCEMMADGSTCISGEIILWDVESRQPLGEPLTGHQNTIYNIAFSPDGKTLASASCTVPNQFPCATNEIILWDVENRQPIGEPLKGEFVYSVAFSPDGKTLASVWCKTTEDACNSFDIILWDVKTRQQLWELPSMHGNSVYSVAFSLDGKILASADLDGTIILWDVENRQPLGDPLRGHQDAVYSLAFSPDGNLLASASLDGTIILWNLAAMQSLGEPLIGHSGQVYSVAFSPDGKTLASASCGMVADASLCRRGQIILWDVETRQPLGEPLIGLEGGRSVDFSSDGQILAAKGGKAVILWNVETRQPLGEPLLGHDNNISSVAFSPDGKTLASASCGLSTDYGCSSGEIILWDVENRQPLGEPLIGHQDAVNSVAFSPEGKTLASAGCGRILDAVKCTGGEIILWDVENHQPLGEPLIGHQDVVTSVAFSPDGQILASASVDKTVILWDVENRQPIGEPLIGHQDTVYSVAFSLDGKILASGSEDKSIILWDVSDPRSVSQLDTLLGHNNIVRSVTFSPDGKTIASASFDSTVILWDVETRQPLGEPLTGHNGFIASVAFSPDGKTIASASDVGIFLWDLKPQSWIEKSCQRTGRNFTHAEWAKYFPSEEYRKTCEQWPPEPEVTGTPTATP